MNALQKLHELLKATSVLAHVPIMQLKENERLLNEIKKIVSPSSINSILNSIQNEAQYDTNSIDLVGGSSIESREFTSKFVNFQNERFKIFSKVKENSTHYSELPQAQNASEISKKNKTIVEQALTEVKNSKPAKDFEEVYNSIFSNHALQIGTSQDPTYIQSYIDFSPYIYNYQHYLSIPTLSQTVDRPIEIALKKTPIVDFKNDELDKFFIKYMKNEKIVFKLKRFLLYSTLSPRGSLIAPELDKDGKVKFLVYNDTQFTYSVMPQYSTFNISDSEYGISNVYLLGKILQPGTTCHFYCPGFEPLFGIGKNKLIPLKGAAEAINIYLYTIKVLCIRAQVMVQKWSGEGQTDTLLASMKKMSDQINSTLSLNTAVKLPEGAELNLLNNNLSEGFAKISPIIKEFQAVLTGVAPDYLYGSDTAYSANSFNIQLSHQNIRSEIQEPGIEPALRYIINTCLLHDPRLEKFRDLENEFEIKFESLYEPTGTEKVNEDKGKIENLVSMAGYPEFEEIFKKENLFPKDSSIPLHTPNPNEVPET